MAADDSAFLARLAELLGDGGLLVDADDRAAYETGWRYGQGTARAVARPRTTDDVAAVLALCHAQGVRVQPIGANTGVVGASNPDASGEQLVVSLEHLASTIDVDPVGRTAVVDAGVTLSALNEALEPHGLFFPIDLGADPQIGGMVATNTGGTRLLRYGSVRDHVLGLEVVLSDGTVWSHLSPLRKDNRGLDLRQLFVGTSGSFGIVTRATLSLAPRPAQTSVAWCALSSGDQALALLAALERELGETLSAFEVLSRDAFELTLRHGSNLADPFDEGVAGVAALVECSTVLSSDVLDLDAAFLATLERFLEQQDDDAVDVVPMPPHDAWSIRHQVSESLRHEGHVLALDVSVPVARIAEFSDEMRREIVASHPHVRVCDFGHWGDGGTHLNVVWDPAAVDDPAALTRAIQGWVYERTVRGYGGSFSAEHGVGPHNQHHYDALSPALLLTTSGVLKRHFDRAGLLGTVRLDGP